ncbi:UNVERIFIED_CONTAM: Tyrosine-protein phosphatase dsp1, partial [Siphonaria sp. JEL0065]
AASSKVAKSPRAGPKATRAPAKAKAAKDANAPKKALSSYFHYLADNRQRFRDENPALSFGQLGKFMGAKWKDEGDDVKQKYAAISEKDKARYIKELAAYEPATAVGAVAAEADEEDEEEADDDE